MNRITIADVAREAGVSTQTVSRVINDKAEITASTRESVMKVIERMGYRPSGVARSLATNKTLTVGLVVPDIANPFFPEIARGAEDVLRERGYEIFLCNTIEDPEREIAVLSALEDKRVDGVIICSSRLPDEQLFPRLRRQQEVVLVNRPAPAELASNVRVDDAFGTMQAVDHLLSAGCEVIGFLSGPTKSHSARQRADGFERALAANDRQPEPSLMVPCAPDNEAGYEAARSLLSERRDLDGLICYNDLVAVGALKACSELGLSVPGDVSIVGCDDIMVAGLISPSLTTIRVSKHELGVTAARLLLERIAGRHEDGEVVIAPELVVRESAPHTNRSSND